jgi:hypothetical protein
MNNAQAFANGNASRNKEKMVFDWIKAANYIVDNNVQHAGAGLANDWEYTGGTIWKEGKSLPEDQTYVYLASTWAIPELETNGIKRGCYIMQSETDNWDSSTYWPKEALKIING